MPNTHRVTLPTPIHAAALRGKASMLLFRMKTQPPGWALYPSSASSSKDRYIHWADGASVDFRCWPSDEPVRIPYAPGDLIACREPWWKDEGSEVVQQPASRMPLAACRLWFRVQSVEARRMIEVTEEEARACGFDSCTAADQLRQAWLAGGTGLGDWAWKLKVERTER